MQNAQRIIPPVDAHLHTHIVTRIPLTWQLDVCDEEPVDSFRFVIDSDIRRNPDEKRGERAHASRPEAS